MVSEQQPAWRQRWADERNRQQYRHYDTWLSQWRNELARIEYFITVAQSWQPDPDPSAELRDLFDLSPDETVYWSNHDAGVIETTDQLDMASERFYEQFLTAVFARHDRAAGSLPVNDRGQAVITNRRISFKGKQTRQWRFDELTQVSYADPSGPLFRTGGSLQVSGLAAEDAKPELWLLLTLALSDYFDQRGLLLNWLREGLAEHRSQPPTPPLPASPEQAPRSAGPFPAKRTNLLAVVVLMLLAGGGIIVDTLPGASSEGDTLGVAVPSPNRQPPPDDRRSPHAGRSPQLSEPAQHSTVPPSSPRASAQDVALCGAPENPYGLRFCHGEIVTVPPAGICGYFDCASQFWEGTGYLVECADGRFALSGGTTASCLHHDGERRVVYR